MPHFSITFLATIFFKKIINKGENRKKNCNNRLFSADIECVSEWFVAARGRWVHILDKPNSLVMAALDSTLNSALSCKYFLYSFLLLVVFISVYFFNSHCLFPSFIFYFLLIDDNNISLFPLKLPARFIVLLNLLLSLY